MAVVSILTPPTWAVAPAFITLRWPLTVVYLGLLLLICVYGLHRYWLVRLYRKHRREHPRPAGRFARLPPITVQLPMYNEGAVAARVIDAACELDYPRDRLEIQVLDDSTDACAAEARRCVERWRQRGVNIAYLHRCDRVGYKAGALQAALPAASGRLIAVFDADFIPPSRFLRRTVHHFMDPAIGMVQARWSHLNREDSLLTRCQAIFLDGHFLVEHTARNRSGAWINFNGTAGVWRRRAIESAGGWRHDTLTEDVDLSYRAQLAGWRFVYLPRLACPAELPPLMSGFKSQQHRWTKGSIQVAIKMLPAVLRAKLPWRVKIEAFFHLTSPMVYLYVTLLAALFYPAMTVNLPALGERGAPGAAAGVALFGLGTLSAAVFYLASQSAQHRSMWATLAQVPVLMAVGVGIALSNALACVEALLGCQSPFVRTPKYGRGGAGGAGGADSPGGAGGRERSATTWRPARRSAAGFAPTSNAAQRALTALGRRLWLVELAMGLYMLRCVWLSFEMDHRHAAVSTPFLLLFATGYFYVGVTGLWRPRPGRPHGPKPGAGVVKKLVCMLRRGGGKRGRGAAFTRRTTLPHAPPGHAPLGRRSAEPRATAP